MKQRKAEELKNIDKAYARQIREINAEIADLEKQELEEELARNRQLQK